jgi:ribosomal protein S18 acetylase RimI-like enzyme
VPISIERIRADEGESLRDVRLRALREAPYAFGTRYEDALNEPANEWTATARASAHGDSRVYFLAHDRPDGGSATVVGMVQARRRPPTDCLLFSMWVAPEARRLGVGRDLVQAVADWGAAWGARRVVLWVTEVNDGAQRFYERIGFNVLREGPEAESGQSYFALAMERPITPAAGKRA